MKKLIIFSNGRLAITEGNNSIRIKGEDSRTIDLPSGVNNLNELETAVEGFTVVVKKTGVEIARAGFG